MRFIPAVLLSLVFLLPSAKLAAQVAADTLALSDSLTAIAPQGIADSSASLPGDDGAAEKTILGQETTVAQDAAGEESGETVGKPPPVPFDGYDPLETNWQWDRAAIVGGILGVTVTGIHIYQQNAWWKDRRTSFHFQNDWDYAMNVDKAGHFYGGALGAFLGRKSLEWSGASRTSSLWGGALMGALFELYIEFEDGFAQDWGFSPGDAMADIAGASWPLLQEYVPGFEHFHPKFSYWPSQALLDGNHDGNMIDDYEGQTFWMGVHVHGLLPRSWKKYWPEWLGIALGLQVRNMPLKVDGQVIYGKPLERHLLIALDYDMTKIIPGDGWLLNALKEGLNFIRFPAPAIRISPDYIAYGLYF